MKRREFLKTSAVAAGAAAFNAAFTANADEQKPAAREFYELRLYHLRRSPMTKRFDEFYSKAVIPAMNRGGIGPVGVFSVLAGADNPTMYVLLPHKSVESVTGIGGRMGADAEYQKLAVESVNAPPNDPAYLRVESSLMVAFESFPKVEVPKLTTEKKSRIFELRTYESHSKKANKKKIEMFNKGEIDIFKRVGITPVFFGESLIGPRLPNLIYMAAFENMAERDKAWAAFGADAEWQKLRSKPEYSDSEIVSNISNVLLKPAAYSQI